MPWIDECLTSIDFGRYKVIAIDNNSSDDTVAYIEKHYPQVKIFPQKENLGFGQANNLGISYALKQGAAYVYLLNQDAYLGEGCLESLLTTHKQNPEYGILSPIHTNAEKNRLDRNFSVYMSYRNNSDFYSDFILDNPRKEVYEVPFVNAAGWLISKECLLTVGGFDPIFFHYGEDDNYCQRVRFHKFKIGVVSSSFMVHDREDREKPNIKPFSEAYFKQRDRSYKIKYADINSSQLNDLDVVMTKIRKRTLKALLRVRIDLFKNHRKELKLIERIKPEILNSVKLNQQKQPNYLDYEN